MTAKKKKAKASARKPKSAPRGMYLTVQIDGTGDFHKEVRVESFAHITQLGHDVAREVRAYLRSVPMLPHVPYWRISVWPRWTPTGAAPARKSKSEDSGDTLDLEDNDGG